jgi:hypothetical protein
MHLLCDPSHFTWRESGSEKLVDVIYIGRCVRQKGKRTSNKESFLIALRIESRGCMIARERRTYERRWESGDAERRGHKHEEKGEKEPRKESEGGLSTSERILHHHHLLLHSDDTELAAVVEERPAVGLGLELELAVASEPAAASERAAEPSPGRASEGVRRKQRSEWTISNW